VFFFLAEMKVYCDLTRERDQGVSARTKMENEGGIGKNGQREANPRGQNSREDSIV